jgi:catechol 2,3-dioxygenase-like lactoylglutathione lyase family enzyme
VSRLQLALNVSNLDEAVDFYSKFFKTAPAKIRPGYANFAITEPPLKLVLFENSGEPGTINHLGVEVFSTDEVVDATRYLAEQGRRRAASRCKTRCGSTDLIPRGGRCTPCLLTRTTP